jgi:hypothetical protein
MGGNDSTRLKPTIEHQQHAGRKPERIAKTEENGENTAGVVLEKLAGFLGRR